MASFKTIGGVRRWDGRIHNYEENEWTFVQDFDSHKGMASKNRKKR